MDDKYYVLHIRTPGGNQWTSIHRTDKGAHLRLMDKIDKWELGVLYREDKLEYGISYLEVEE